MPSLAVNVTMMKRANSNYSREEILAAINEMVEIVYDQDMEQVIKIDSATGLPPFIVTSAGVYEYDCPSDCRRTARIFTETISGYSTSARRSPWGEYVYQGKSYYRVPIRSYDADVQDTLAKVVFETDPGATTEVYYHQYYTKHVELTDESQSILLPSKVHYLVRRGALALLAGEDYGESGHGINMVDDVARRIRNTMNSGAQARSGMTHWQPEQRNYEDCSGEC